MFLKRKIVSFIFLSIYAIVFAHMVIPHHHHSEEVAQCQIEALCFSKHATVQVHPEPCCDQSNHAFCVFNIKQLNERQLLSFLSPYFRVNKHDVLCLTPSDFIFSSNTHLTTQNSCSANFYLRGPPAIS